MLLWTAFLLGLIGSCHCAGMCGPLVLALPRAGATGFAFVRGRLLYHLGRVATYGLLGILFGSLGKSFALVGLQQWASILAGVTILLACIGSSRFRISLVTTRSVGRLKAALGSLLRRKDASALLLLGLLNGLLPCGLVYVAGAGAMAGGSPGIGAASMVAFGLGTLPMMLGIGLAGGSLSAALRFRFQKFVPLGLLLLGTLLILRGMSLGIPYVSSNLLGAPGALHCH